MDQLFKQISNDANQYIDINSIFLKLQENGNLQKIYSLFENIFQQENQFAYNELSKIMEDVPKDKYFDIDMQLKMNTQIFKSNFEIIVQLLINRIWQKVQSEMPQQNNQQTNPQLSKSENDFSTRVNVQSEQQIQQIASHQLIEIPNTTSQQQITSKVQKQQQQQQPQTQVPASLQEMQSDENIKEEHNKEKLPESINSIKAYKNKIQSQLLTQNSSEGQLNSSWVRKSLSFQKKMLGSKIEQISQSQNDLLGRRETSPSNNSKILFADLKKQQEKKLMNLSQNISMASMRSQNANNTSKIGGSPVPFSEIPNDIRANTSFSRAQRECLSKTSNVEYSPGPAEYNPLRAGEVIRKQSPNTKFDKSPKTCWIDEKLHYDSSVQSPGPKYDYQKVKTSNNQKQLKPKK